MSMQIPSEEATLTQVRWCPNEGHLRSVRGFAPRSLKPIWVQCPTPDDLPHGHPLPSSSALRVSFSSRRSYT